MPRSVPVQDTAPPLRFLIIDDNRSDAYLVRQCLDEAFTKRPPQLEHAATIDEAMSRLDGSRYDLLLIDFRLGADDGISLLRRIRARGIGTPAIFLTGYGNEEIVAQALKAGVDDYVPKGAENLPRLPDAVRHTLARFEQRRALEEAERRYRMLYEAAPVGVFQTAKDGTVLGANPAALQILGCQDLRALLGLNSRDFYADPKDRKRWMEVMESEGAVQGMEARCRRLDGQIIWARVSALAIRDGAGRLVSFEGTLEDITPRMEAEEALRRSEARKTSILDAALDAIITIDAAGRITEFNPAAERMLGYGRTEALGRELAELIIPPAFRAGHREGLARYLATSEPRILGRRIEMTAIRRDGSEFPVELAITRVPGDGPVQFTGFMRDQSERRQAEDALRRSEEQLRSSQKMEAVGRLAGGVAHDFNNLLTVIQGHSELLLARLRSDDPIRKEIEQIRKAGERAAGLTRQLLAFSRRQVLQARVLDLNEVVADMEKMLRRLIGEDIDLITRLGPRIAHVKADPGQLEQVIMNLAVNARDAMPEGGRLIIETADTTLDEKFCRAHPPTHPGPYVMLALTDTGSGMAPETLSYLFEPFFTTKEKGKGTGLGLATVYGIVKQSDGYVWVESEPGKGSSFRIYLPPVEGPAQTVEPKTGGSGVDTGSETILLVEDEPVVRELARRILEMNGYNVLEAGDVGEARRLCGTHPEPIHLLVTDVVMPVMSGRGLADALSSLRPEMRVLYMSGYTDDAIVRHGILLEGVPFLQKPFTPQRLAAKVREVLDLPRD